MRKSDRLVCVEYFPGPEDNASVQLIFGRYGETLESLLQNKDGKAELVPVLFPILIPSQLNKDIFSENSPVEKLITTRGVRLKKSQVFPIAGDKVPVSLYTPEEYSQERIRSLADRDRNSFVEISSLRQLKEIFSLNYANSWTLGSTPLKEAVFKKGRVYNASVVSYAGASVPGLAVQIFYIPLNDIGKGGVSWFSDTKVKCFTVVFTNYIEYITRIENKPLSGLAFRQINSTDVKNLLGVFVPASKVLERRRAALKKIVELSGKGSAEYAAAYKGAWELGTLEDLRGKLKNLDTILRLNY